MIEGVLSTYSVGDYVTANCTSGKSNPPAALTWKINGQKVCICQQFYLSHSPHDIIKITFFLERIFTNFIKSVKKSVWQLAVKRGVIHLLTNNIHEINKTQERKNCVKGGSK
jgi:hypothetical protein